MPAFNFVDLPEGNLLALVRATQLATPNVAEIDDRDRGMRSIADVRLAREHVHQPRDRNFEARLLARLAHGRFGRRLAWLDPAARQAPQPIVGAAGGQKPTALVADCRVC